MRLIGLSEKWEGAINPQTPRITKGKGKMSADANKGLSFSLGGELAVSAFGSLTGAFQLAFEFAVFPERLKVEADGALSGLEALTKQFLREAKSFPVEGISEADEAAGMRAAAAIIEDVSGQLRRGI